MDNEKEPTSRPGQGTFTITNAAGETTGPLPFDTRTLTPEQLRIAGYGAPTPFAREIERKQLLAMLDRERYPLPGQPFPSVDLIHALIEGVFYLVQNTPISKDQA